MKPILWYFHIGVEDFNLYTSELLLTRDALSSGINVEAVRDDEDKSDGMFESFRLRLRHGPNILPPNVVLGRTVITIENVGKLTIQYTELFQ